MAEYIKKEDAINLFWPVDPENDGSDGYAVILKCGRYSSNKIEAMLSDLPAADVAEVMHGRWEEVDWVELEPHGLETIRTPKAGLRCSRCSNVFKKELLWKDNYCPNCGACMDKEVE